MKPRGTALLECNGATTWLHLTHEFADAADDVRFRDRYSWLDSLADLSAHAGAAQRFMPGIGLRGRGEIRQCQGMVLVDWVFNIKRRERGNERHQRVSMRSGRTHSICHKLHKSGTLGLIL